MFHKDFSPANSKNSFLVETTFNSDIGIEIRKNIENKYKNSKCNHDYVFPRKDPHVNHFSKKAFHTKIVTKEERLDKSLPHVNAFRIYSREVLSLKKLWNISRKMIFHEKQAKQLRSLSKKHQRNQSSPYRANSPYSKQIDNCFK